MKITLYKYFFTFLVVTAVILCGCELPEDNTGVITINLGEAAARTAGWNKAVGTAGLDLKYEIIITNSATGAIERSEASGESGKVTMRVNPGSYTMKLNAFVNGWDYATGTADEFSIAARESKNVPVTMQRLPNAVVLSIPKGETLGSTVAIGDEPKPMSVTIYNFTDKTTLAVEASLTANKGFFFYDPGAIVLDIEQDKSAELVIYQDVDVSKQGTFTSKLTVTWAGGTATADLSLTVGAGGSGGGGGVWGVGEDWPDNDILKLYGLDGMDAPDGADDIFYGYGVVEGINVLVIEFAYSNDTTASVLEWFDDNGWEEESLFYWFLRVGNRMDFDDDFFEYIEQELQSLQFLVEMGLIDADELEEMITELLEEFFYDDPDIEEIYFFSKGKFMATYSVEIDGYASLMVIVD